MGLRVLTHPSGASALRLRSCLPCNRRRTGTRRPRGIGTSSRERKFVRYYIRQKGEYVSGPHDLDQIRAWIKEGKVREEMEFSEDQVEWMWGIELPELFARSSRRRRRRGVW